MRGKRVLRGRGYKRWIITLAHMRPLLCNAKNLNLLLVSSGGCNVLGANLSSLGAHAASSLLNLGKSAATTSELGLFNFSERDGGHKAGRLAGDVDLLVELVDLLEGKTLGLVDEKSTQRRCRQSSTSPR